MSGSLIYDVGIISEARQVYFRFIQELDHLFAYVDIQIMSLKDRERKKAGSRDNMDAVR